MIIFSSLQVLVIFRILYIARERERSLVRVLSASGPCFPKGQLLNFSPLGFEKLIFQHAFGVRKTKRTAKFYSLEPRRREDTKGITAPKISQASLGTSKKTGPRSGTLFSSSPLSSRNLLL